MPHAAIDDECVYGQIPINYRSAASAQDLPLTLADSTQARALIPNKPGFGTPNTTINKQLEANTMKMLNGRLLREAGEEPYFDQHSFMFAEAPLAFRGDWEDVEDVRAHYLPEVEQLVRRSVPGADHPDTKVLIFDHAIRTHNRHLKDADRKRGMWGGYANSAHTDATVRSIHTRCKDQVMGTNECEAKYNGVYPDCWGDVRPTKEWQRKLFRAEDQDHDSPEGEGGGVFSTSFKTAFYCISAAGLILCLVLANRPHDRQCLAAHPRDTRA